MSYVHPTVSLDLFENLEYIALTDLVQQPPTTVLFCIHSGPKIQHYSFRL